jgi:cytochrome P450
MHVTSLMDLKKQSTPTEFTHFIQQQGDVFWWEKGNFWVVSNYDYAKKVLLSDDYTCDRSSFFISRMPELNLALVNDFFDVVSKMMVMSDAPEHTKRRRICYHGFGNHSIDQLTPLIQKTIDKGLATLAQQGSIDFVPSFAETIPSTTLADFFNIPETDRMDFYHWSNNMTQFFGGSTSYLDADGIKVNDSAKTLKDYFFDLLATRRRELGDDFLSVLLTHQDHFGLTDEEIVSQAIMMLVAGQVSTTDQMCNNLYALLMDPQAKELALKQPEQLEKILEECTRLDPAVTFTFRVTKNQTHIGQQPIAPGDVIFISNHAVNRDKAYFSNPDKIDIEFNQAKNFSYGFGGHFCLGAKLARVEMLLCVQSLLQRFPTLHVDENKPIVRKHHSLSFSGFQNLPLKI